MNIREFTSYLPYLFQSKVTPMVWGLHGVGKTSVPQQYADANGHRLFNLRLGNMELGDLLGLADFQTDADGNKVATSFFKPDWLKDLFDFAEANPDKYAIIFLDELNRTRKDMMNPVFQMALEYRLHTYQFPANVRVIAGGNPPIDGYWVNDFTESALMDRFCHLALRPETAEWLSYAGERGLHADWIDFISDQPHQLHSMQASFSIDEYCKPSNRSTEAAARLYSIGAPKELIFGCVGAIAGGAFYNFVEKNKEVTVDPEELFTYTKKTRKAVAAMVEKGRHAQVKMLCTRLAESMEKTAVLDEEKGIKPREYTMKEGANICDFLRDIPIDISFGSARILSKYVELARVMSYDPDHDGKGYEQQDLLVDHYKKALNAGQIDRAAFDNQEKEAKAS